MPETTPTANQDYESFDPEGPDLLDYLPDDCDDIDDMKPSDPWHPLNLPTHLYV